MSDLTKTYYKNSPYGVDDLTQKGSIDIKYTMDVIADNSSVSLMDTDSNYVSEFDESAETICKHFENLEKQVAQPISVQLVICDSDGTAVFNEYVGSNSVAEFLELFSSSYPDILKRVHHFINPLGRVCYVTRDAVYVASISGILSMYTSFSYSEFIKMIDSPSCTAFNFIVTY
jgi:hypothetical protein